MPPPVRRELRSRPEAPRPAPASARFAEPAARLQDARIEAADDQNLGPALGGGQEPQQFDPVHVGKGQVERDRVGLAGDQRIHEILGIVGDGDFVPAAPGDPLDQPGHRGLIVDNQKSFHLALALAWVNYPRGTAPLGSALRSKSIQKMNAGKRVQPAATGERGRVPDAPEQSARGRILQWWRSGRMLSDGAVVRVRTLAE
jgi:hypothetical protein